METILDKIGENKKGNQEKLAIVVEKEAGEIKLIEKPLSKIKPGELVIISSADRYRHSRLFLKELTEVIEKFGIDKCKESGLIKEWHDTSYQRRIIEKEGACYRITRRSPKEGDKVIREKTNFSKLPEKEIIARIEREGLNEQIRRGLIIIWRGEPSLKPKPFLKNPNKVIK